MSVSQVSKSNPKKLPTHKAPMPPSSSSSSDTPSILLLLLLYLLQGIPLGLISAIPMILQNHHISYTEQAKFSFSYWPFSLKLLWAPIVDSVYSERIGRRKTWLIPMQYGIGLFMFVLSGSVDQLIEGGNVNLLTAIFFMLNFLAATQDIAVDGWALTMLKRENVGYASTCNSVGQTAGYFLGYVVFLALESTDFCNKYLRMAPEDTGLVTLPGFLRFWSWVFVITTTVVWLCKSEDDVEDNEVLEVSRNHNNNFQKHYQTIVTNYKGLWKIFKLSNIKLIIAVLLTVKIGFAVDSVTGLKLVEAGVPKDRLALLAIPMTPLQILLPFLISKYTAGPRPMDIFLLAMPFRLLFGFVFAWIVHITPSFQSSDGTFPYSYYIMIMIAYSLHQVTLYSMFVAVMSFFAIVSDPVVGGTYMTLLNTVSNLGGNWPSTVALWGVDKLTWKVCENDPSNRCGDSAAEQICITSSLSKCITNVDGYYVETIICVVFGFIWLLWGRPVIRKLQRRPLSTWKVQDVQSSSGKSKRSE